MNLTKKNILIEKKKDTTKRQASLLWLLVTFTGVCSNALIGVFIRWTDVGSIAAALYRLVFSWPLFVVYFIYSKENFIKPTKRDLFLIIMAASLIASGFAIWNLAFRYTSIANVTLISNLLPFVTIPLAWFFFDKKIGKLFLISLFISTTGLVLILFSQLSFSIDKITGDLLSLAVTVIYGVYVVFLTEVRKRIPATQTMFYCTSIAMIILLPLTFLLENNVLPKTITSLFSLLGIAWFGHMGGAFLIVIGMGYISSAFCSIIIMLQPIVGAIYGYVFFNEILSKLQIIGIGLAIGGVILIQLFSEKGEELK